MTLHDLAALAAALSDANRVRAVLALRGGELCLCQIIDLLGLAPSTVSKHMAVLHAARLVARRKEGRWHYYRLQDDASDPAIAAALDWVSTALSRDAEVRADARRVRAVRRTDRVELCVCYRGEAHRAAERN